MLDRSGSVGAANHQIAIRFITSVVSFFSIGRNASRVGMVAYSGGSQIQFDLDDHLTSSSLNNAIRRVAFTGDQKGVLELNFHFYFRRAVSRSHCTVL